MGTRLRLIALLLLITQQSQGQPEIWGVTSEGGDFGIGAIYKTAADGSGLTVMKSLRAVVGRSPMDLQLLQVSDGKLYGVTYQGGQNLEGVLFSYDPATAEYKDHVHFAGLAKGKYPTGGLTAGTNGKLYGMTFSGGTSDYGVVYEFDPVNGAFAKVADFSAGTGQTPSGRLVLFTDGKFYGVTSEGGTSNNGTLFAFDPSDNTLTKKKDFDVNKGTRPFGGLILSANGMLLGLASEGGSSNKGTLFEYDPVLNSLTKRVDFQGTTNGDTPLSHLVQASNGLVYGMTLLGGANNMGSLFEYNTTTFVLTKKADFDGTTKGQLPYGGLMQASNGKLYGMTEQGLLGYGGLFEYNIGTAMLTNLITYDGSFTGKGSSPRSTPVQALNGKLYGCTRSGGLAGDGVLFEMDPTSLAYSVKVSFNKPESGNWPLAPVVQGLNGRIYGTTYLGGTSNGGVLFEHNLTTGDFATKVNFTFLSGHSVTGQLFPSDNGKLYGLARFGGVSNGGTLFEYNPATNAITAKFSFHEANTGRPIGSLVLGPNGKLYGVTDSGGLNNKGILFEYAIESNTLIKIVDFDGPVLGESPSGSLLAAGALLFGLTNAGGASNYGTVFQFDPSSGTATKKADFNGSNGANPVGALVIVPGDKLVGVSRRGGTANWGTLFEFDLNTSTLTRRHSFSGILSDGLDIQAGLMISSNGKAYGTTEQGGTNNRGVFYEFDLATNTYTKKADFIGSNGARPIYSTPILVSMAPQTITFDALNPKTYGDPAFSITPSVDTGLPLTITSSNTTVATVNGTTVTLVGAGTSTITVSQEGNKNYHSAVKTRELVVAKANPVLTFTAPGPKVYGDPNIALTATSTNSQTAITFTSSNTAVATVNGPMLTIVGAGTTTLTASQAGSINYNSTSSDQVFDVAKAAQEITFGSLSEKLLFHPPFQLNAFSTSGLPIAYTSSDETVATVSGNTVTIHTAGTTEIEASQPGNNNFLSANPVSQTLQIAMVTAVEPQGNAAVDVYPNPVRDNYFINTGQKGGPSTIQLLNFDVHGRIFRATAESMEDGVYRGSTESMPDGIYMLSIEGINRKFRLVVIH